MNNTPPFNQQQNVVNNGGFFNPTTTATTTTAAPPSVTSPPPTNSVGALPYNPNQYQQQQQQYQQQYQQQTHQHGGYANLPPNIGPPPTSSPPLSMGGGGGGGSTYTSALPPPTDYFNAPLASQSAPVATVQPSYGYQHPGGVHQQHQHQQQQPAPTTTLGPPPVATTTTTYSPNQQYVGNYPSFNTVSSAAATSVTNTPGYGMMNQQQQQLQQQHWQHNQPPSSSPMQQQQQQDFEGGGMPSYMYQQPQQQQQQQQDVASQMAQLSLNQQHTQPLQTNITTGNVDSLPRPTRPEQLLYDKTNRNQSKRTQPDVTGIFARQARSMDPNSPPHNFNCAQSSTTFLRSTVQCIPSTPSLMQKWHLPLGAVIHPFADSEKVPLVAMGAAGIVRCAKCRTYVNPFVVFLEYGKKWQCNMCKNVNDVPNGYYCPLDDNGVRKDFFRRPELLHGSVEFIAPQEYMARVPQPPAYLFLLDASYNAIQNGMFRSAASAILSVIDKFPARTQIGFITFDSSIHFYNLKSSLTVPQMLVVGELEESLLPLPSDLLVNLHDSKTVVRALLERFSAPDGMFANTTNVESALGAALNAAGRILGRIGGKLSIFLSNLPTLGPNALTNREDMSVYGTDAETALLSPIDNRFKEFALLYCRDQISVDIYAMAEQQGSQYLDLASLTCLSKFTGGITQYYGTDSNEKLKGDVVRALSRETGFEAVMRVRASSGLKVSAFYGNLFIRGHDLLALPNVDADKAYGIELQHTGSFVSTPNACMQVAVLYTSSSGQRRIRVHNLMLPITNEILDMYKEADVDASINLMAKIAVDNVPRKGLTFVKNDIRDRVVRAIAGYKHAAKQGIGFSQLVLPESLRLLPLYACALTKQDALIGGQEVRADTRVFAFNCLTTANCIQSNLLIHPLAFAVNEIGEENNGYPQNSEEETGEEEEDFDLFKCHLHPLSRKLVNIETATILLCDGLVMYVWLGKQPLEDESIHSDIREITKSLNSSSEQSDEADEEYVPQTRLGTHVKLLAKSLRREIGSVMPLRFVNAQSELWQRVFVRKLIEDKTIPSTMSYDEFLVHIHNSMK